MALSVWWWVSPRRRPMSSVPSGRRSTQRWSALRERPKPLVEEPVPEGADECEDGEVGRAAEEPGDEVVGFGERRGAVMAGDDAAAVADDEGFPLCWAHDPGGPAEVER